MHSTTTRPATDSVVVLGDIEWETYQSLRGLDANRNVRMTYDHRVLVLMSPSKLHERIAELLAQMVVVWTDELAIPRHSVGSTTMMKQLF